MKKYLTIISIIICGFANAQTGYLVQPAKWKFIKPQWLDSGMWIKNIPKYGGQNRVLVYDSTTNRVGYKYISNGATYTAGRGLTLNSNIFRLDTTQSYTWTNAKTIFNATPITTPNYGLINFGNGGFTGGANHFTGSSSGTLIAGNLASGSTSDLMNLQVGGSSKFKVTSFGLATVESITNNSTARTALFFPNAGAGICWNNNATIKAPGAGVITISNEGETDFNRLQFGGTTSSFPALKRNATGLQPQLADDSGSARWLQGQGADVASASTITLGSGNSFELTGTTAVTLITSTGWTEGSIITLIANENVTITNGTATSGSAVTIKLAGATNFAMTADDTLTLIYSSTTAGGIAWREVSRSVN